jgi:hypothetical protein
VGRKFEEPEEQPRQTHIFRKFKGVVNNSARNALPEDAWFYLENMQPIGDANVVSVPGFGPTLATYANIVYWSQYANVGGVDYIINFPVDGTVWAYAIVAQTNTQIGSGFSGSASRIAQWKNTELLVIDSTGYYNWPGTGTLTLISGTGVPTSGTDIAVAFGRVWIVQGRLLTFSGANDFSAASFLVANGAGSLALTDPTLRNNVTRLSAQNGYLYIISATAINAISDVYVPANANPPTPLFTNLNIQAIIGSDQPASVFAMNQALVFCNRYGAWYLYGTDANKISTDIDGTWQYLDFSQQISGGQAVINNILCTAFLIKRLNDPIFGSQALLALYHDQKWWFAYNFGATLVTSAVVNNVPTLFLFSGTQMVQCFVAGVTPLRTQLWTPLWPLDDELADKQVIRAGFEANVTNISGLFFLSIDSENGSEPTLSSSGNSNVVWQNNLLNTVTWQNNLLVTVQWLSNGYELFNATSPGVYGKYIGGRIQATSSAWQFSAFNFDYKLRARWK